MKGFLKRICACALIGCFMINAAGCKEETTQSSDAADVLGSLTEEDMPYGATMVQLRPEINDKVKIMIEYDDRFLTEEEAIKISDYISALNTADGALMEQTYYPPYLSYICDQTGYANATEYLASRYENIKEGYIGQEFEFDYILTTECLDETADDATTGFSSLDATLDGLGSEKVSDKITSRKMVSFDMMYTLAEDGGSYSFSNIQGRDSKLYIYTIDGQIYVI